MTRRDFFKTLAAPALAAAGVAALPAAAHLGQPATASRVYYFGTTYNKVDRVAALLKRSAMIHHACPRWEAP